MTPASKLPPAFEGASSGAAETSNVGATGLPFQRWYNFKEAFTPRFVEEVVTSMPHHVRTCLDPFGGCGTTALSCQFLGVAPTTIEVNPFLADIIECKLTEYDVGLLSSDRLSLRDRCGAAELLLGSEPEIFPGAPETFVEPGVKGRWIFDAAVARRLAVYLEAISTVEDPRNRRLFRVLLGSVMIPVSNVVISGKGRRYRSGWATRPVKPRDVDRLFSAAFHQAFYDICRYPAHHRSGYLLLRGDSRLMIRQAPPVDLVLFSPPYPNSFDYTDIYNVELWALGYLRSAAENRTLREATLRSHVQIKRDFADSDFGSVTLAETLHRLDQVKEHLWNRHIPEMVSAYFADLSQVCEGARDVLTDAGQIVMVVGDSSYAGVLIDVPAILREILPTLGLMVEEVRAVRSMRNSPQHGGEFALGESLIRIVRI